MKRTVFIIDIDTTIADTDFRATLLKRECLVCLDKVSSKVCLTCGSTDVHIVQSSWDHFLDPEVMRHDPPVKAAQRAIRAMRQHDMEFYFVTGRNDGLREVTVQWLTEHFDFRPLDDVLVMRSQQDANIPASVYKEKALKGLIKEHQLAEASLIFFEDDPHVFRVYQKYGIVVKCPGGWDFWVPPAATGAEKVWNR